jgi:XRE family transcriptional regulator, fatty acid utilization regulator
MEALVDRKLFLGARLKRVRRDLGLTQTAMAADLGVSPSYLNHIERNQRPVSAQLLLRLADTYDIDLRALNQGGAADEARLGEILADPLFKGLSAPRHELVQLLEEAPGVADALLRLYQAFDDGRTRARAAAENGEGLVETSPAEWVREYVQSHDNHFPELDQMGEALAEALAAEAPAHADGFEPAARLRLAAKHDLGVRTLPAEVMGGMDPALRPAPPPAVAVRDAGALVARLRHRLPAGASRTRPGPA